MNWKRNRFAPCIMAVLIPVAAMGAVATIRVEPVDGQAQQVGEAVFVFARTDDPSVKFSVGQNDLGQYLETVTVEGAESEWELTRVVATGYLPVKVSLKSYDASGETVQEVAPLELGPAVPIPPIRILADGAVRIELVLGDQREVMAKFLEERNKEMERKKAEALKATPDGPYETALRLYGAGDVDGAMPHFSEALEQDPSNAEIHLTYANVLYKAKRFEEFERAAPAALELQPDNRELWMMLYSSKRTRGDLQGALDALLGVKKLGGQPGDLAQHLTFVAQKMGRGAQAIPAWEALLELDGTRVDACVALASLHADAGRLDESETYLRRAVELAPDDAPTVYFDLGSSLLAAKDASPRKVTRAIELLRKTIELDAGYAPAYKKLGLALWKRQDWPATREALQKYLELDPNAADKDQVQGYLESLPQ